MAFLVSIFWEAFFGKHFLVRIFLVRIPNGRLSRYFFFELGGLNSTGLGWFGVVVFVCNQLFFAKEGRTKVILDGLA